jgi:hypothetical protein
MIITIIKLNNVYFIQIIQVVIVQPKMRKEKVRFTILHTKMVYYKSRIHDVE